MTIAEALPAANSAASSIRPSSASHTLLDAAIERGGLQPVFQARISMATGRIAGAEALARIATPQGGASAPAAYVELAERSDRIDALTYAMTRAVGKHVASFADYLPCSINISPVSLENADFAPAMAALIAEAGLPCERFTLEITDGSLIEYGPQALGAMQHLREFGFALSADDFGAGLANIDRLEAYPFTEIKLDPSFTQHALEERFARIAMEATARLARKLGLRVVAEGIETREMLQAVKSLGVDEAQGFLLSRPLPPADYRELVASAPVFPI
jgi:EAL domain-containing protein (putative c-di-GMP-specific phosphodiesterase class I)